MKKIIRYLNLNHLGFLEILLALYPILAAYKYGFINMSHVVLLFLDIVILFKGNAKLLKFKPLLLFVIYYVLHQLVYIVLLGLKQSYYINSTIGNLIFLFSLFIIVPTIDFKKFEGAINWVSIICLLGLFYQVALVVRGEIISPIPLPFMPTPEVSRLSEMGIRPGSFFMEPQAYVSYMIFTMFFALREQKYVWAVLVGGSIILSTSTTGLIFLPIMITSFLFLGHSKWYNKLIMVLLLFGLAYFFFNSELAATGLDKLEKSDVSENSRTSNGPALASTMNFLDLLLGVPCANATDYYHSTKGLSSRVIPDIEGNVFISGFWQALIFLGIIGLFLYLSIYWKILKEDRETIPLLGCLIVGMISNSDFIGAYWFFSIAFLITFVNTREPQTKNIGKRSL